LDSVSDLLAAIERLPDDRGRVARARVAAAIERPADEARVALGLLALDLADDTIDTIVLPDLATSRVSR
jgi:hypothetical protein